jgi:RND family efflux transporter MFP subunit
MWTRVLVPIGIITVAALIALGLFNSRPQASQQPPLPPALLVDTVTASKQRTVFAVHTQGEVTPRTQTTLISEVSGQIVEVSSAFVSGGFFERGDVLVRIDPRIYETQLKRARAQVASARTQVATENALAGYAYQDWKRLRDLTTSGKPASDLTLRKPQVAQAIAGLESAEAELEKAQGDLTRTVIRAPYDGMVREKRSDVGQFVNSGTPLALTFATDYAEVRLPVTQNDLEYLDLPNPDSGRSIPVTLNARVAGEERTWQASLVRSEGVFDPQSRVLYMVAQVPQPYQTSPGNPEPLRIGTFVEAEIRGRDAGDLFAIPRHALYRNDQVWLVDDDDHLRGVTVNVVRSDKAQVYIDSGIDEGDRVCITPIDQPITGMLVRS